MPELLWAQGEVCRNFCGLRGGYSGTLLGLEGGGTPELLALRGGNAGTFGGLGGYARTFGGFGGDMPEILWA